MGKIPTDASNSSKPIIILDLDETLISSLPSKEYGKKQKEKAKQFEFENMDDYYIVFQRPGLQKFLDYLFENYTVSIWTAATKDYAVFVVDKILIQNKPERRVDMTLFSYHCDISKERKKGSKDLSMLWDVFELDGYNKDNVVIFDDYSEVQKTNPHNHVKAKPFKFTSSDSESDTHLVNVQATLEKIKDHIKNGGTSPGSSTADPE